MASRTQIRLDQVTGSLGNQPGKIHDGLGVGESTLAATTLQSGSMVGLMSEVVSSIKRIHGQDTFANNAIGEFKTDIVPEADGTRDLGSATKEWAEVHTNAVKSAAAFTLAGSAGVGMTSTTFDVDASGAMTLDAASLTIGGDNDTGAIAVDSTAGISLDAAAASNLSTSDGTLTIEAGGANDKLVLKGDHESGVAVHIDANAAAASQLDIDAGLVTMDADDTIKITAADEVEVVTTSADGHILLRSDHTAGVAVAISGSAAAGSIVDIDAGILQIDAVGVAGINSGGTLSLGTANSGVAVSIGHTTSEVTVNDNLTVTGDLTVNGTTTTIDTTNLLVEDPVVLLNKNNSSANGQGGIAIERGGSATDMVFGRVANDTWGVGTKDTSGGAVTTLADMLLGSLRGGKFEVGASTTHLSQSAGTLTVTAAADIVLAAGGNDILPGDDKLTNLGSAAAQFKSLRLAQGDENHGLMLDDDGNSSIRSIAGDNVAVRIGGSDKFEFLSAFFGPLTDEQADLGSSSLRFRQAHVKTLSASAGLGIDLVRNNDSTMRKSGTSGNLIIKNSVDFVDADTTKGLILLADAFFTGSTYADGAGHDTNGIPLALAVSEYNTFETNFGEVSIINAINQARSGTPGAGKLSVEVSSSIPAGGNLEITQGADSLDHVGVGAASVGSLMDVFVNGQLVLSGAASGAGKRDYFLGTTTKDIKFTFDLVPDDIVSVIIR